MKSLWGKIKQVPLYGWLAGPFFIAFEYLFYRLWPILSKAIGTYSYLFAPKIPFIDDNIPLVPFFIIIYVLAYAFWFFSYVPISLGGKRHFLNCFIGQAFSYFVGFIFFVFMPTCIDRVAEGAIQAAQGPGFIRWWLRLIYVCDGKDLGLGLFPSFHCLSSIYCYLGVRKLSNVSKGYKIYAIVMTILICMSTVFTKQHYFADIIGGLAVPIIVHAVIMKINPASRLIKEKL